MVTVVGKDDKSVHRITCRSCASILEYTRAEVLRVDGTDYSGGPDGCEYIKCPVCGRDAVIKAW